MLIFLKWVNWTFQILEPIMHLCVFQTEKWAEEKPIFIILAFCIIWLVFSEIILKRLSDLEIYKMYLVSCPIHFFSQEMMLKTLPFLAISISDLWIHLGKAVLKKRKKSNNRICIENNGGHTKNMRFMYTWIHIYVEFLVKYCK